MSKCNTCTESKSTKHIVEKDVRPISLTSIASKTLESITLNMVNEKLRKTLTATNFVNGGGGFDKGCPC